MDAIDSVQACGGKGMGPKVFVPDHVSVARQTREVYRVVAGR
jgi:hypothetical protein